VLVLEKIRTVFCGQTIRHGNDYAFSIAMKTLLVRGDDEPPPELRAIVHNGSTEVDEIRGGYEAWQRQTADRVVIWNGRDVIVDGRGLRWPDDLDELKLLLETGG
jgi:hypothetical protein